MIGVTMSAARLVQRLRARADRIAATRAASLRRSRRSSGEDWHSATALWPDFTADIAASGRIGS